MRSTLASTSRDPAPPVMMPTPSRKLSKTRTATADLPALVKLLREAMSAVDNLPKQATAAEDNDAMTAAMEPVNALFSSIKAASPNNPADLVLQLSIIDEVAGWLGSANDDAMEEISGPEFRQLTANARAMLSAPADGNNPPQMMTAPVDKYAAMDAVTTIIDSKIAPIGDEADLLDQLLYLKDENDIYGAISLYNAMLAIADGALLIKNQPICRGRSKDVLTGEWERHIARAYLVADLMKDMRPNQLNIDQWAETLTSCAFRMGSDLSDIAKILHEASLLQKALPEITL